MDLLRLVDEIVDNIVEDDELDVLVFIEYGLPRQVCVRQNHFENLDDVNFIRIIARLNRRFVTFPKTEERTKNCQRKFYSIASFPRVIGGIDHTSVKIGLPGENDAELFRKRKSYFSVNVQMTCSVSLKITNVVSIMATFWLNSKAISIVNDDSG
ncbi:hypothetical protein Trydic_g8492 [Trypoxylus dichotomus]